MKIALFQHTKYEWVSIFKDDEAESFSNSSYHRVSEWMEVEFQPLPKEVIVAGAMGVISKEILSAQARANEVINDWNEVRSKYLALTHQTGE